MNKIKPVKRLLPVLLSLIMVIAMLPISAAAEDMCDEGANSGILPELDEGASTGEDITGVGLLKSDFTPMSIDPDHAYVVGEDSYPTLEEALGAVTSDGTIVLQKNASPTVSNTITINKNITFDFTNGYLSIFKSSGLALDLKNCTVSVMGSGYLDVAGGVGIAADNAAITIRNVTGNQGNGANAINGGEITVLGNAQGYSGAARAYNGGSIKVSGNSITTGPSSTVADGSNGSYVEVGGDATTSGGNSTGISANNSSQVYVKGSVSAVQNGVTVYGNSDTQATVDGNVTVSGTNAYGVSASGGGSIVVGGDVKAEASGSTGIYANEGAITVAGNVRAGTTGAHVINAAEVTIEGTLTVLDGVYIQFENSNADILDYVTDPSKPGYRKYTDGESTVWVKDTETTDNVCEIGGTEYATLDEALAAVQNGESATIKLLQNITYNKGIAFSYDRDIKINFDLSGFTLNIINTDGPGLALTSGEINYTDDTPQPGQFNVTGTTCGVYADGKGVKVKVTNATATAPSHNNDSESYGVYARYGAEIQVVQNAQGNKYGAYANDAYGGQRSSVVVGGNAIAENVCNAGNPRTGAIATNYADIEVGGNATGGYHGVYAGGNSTAKVGGNATGGMYGAYAELTSTVEVAGNVEATENYGIGAYNLSNDSTVTVEGNSITSASTGIGAAAIEGNITIDGIITAAASTYVRVGTTDKKAGEYTKDAGNPNYRKYSNDTGQSTVWVRDTTATTNVCEIANTGYPTLDEALAAVQSGQTVTIKLLTDINYTNPIVIVNRNITFDLNSYDLTIDTSAIESSIALEIMNNGKVDYTGSGSFIVKGYWCGVFMDGGEASVTSTQGKSTNNNSVGAHVQNSGKLSVAGSATGCRWGVFAEGNSEISIGGNAIGTALYPYDSCGAQAESGSTITITGNAESEDVGIYVRGTNSKITVGSVASIATGGRNTAAHVEDNGQAFILGDCTVNSEEGTAIFVTSGGQVTIDGIIHNVGHNSKYIEIYSEEFDGSPAGRIIPTTKSGYHTYATENGTVWVKETTIAVLPNVLTNPVTNISSTGATFNGFVSSDGGSPVTGRGFVYGTSVNPAIGAGTQVMSGDGIGGLSETITGLTPNTTYHVRAYAINSAGTAYGSDVSFTTLSQATVPDAPQNFTVTPGNGQVVLNWTAPASNGGAAIIRYEVSSNNGGTWIAASSTTSHTFTGLANGTEYTFKVRAVNSAGNGAETTATATPQVSVTVPAVPQYFTATPGSGQAALSWTAPASNGGAAIIRYEVSSNNGGTWVTASSNTSHTFTGLINGTSYTFKVRAVNSAGNGAEASAMATPGSGGGGGDIGGGSPSSSDNYTSTSNWTISVDKQPNMPTTATVSITGTADTNGNLSITITDAMVKEAIEKAQAEAKRLGKEADGIIIEVKFTTANDVKTLTAKLDQAALDRLNTAGAGMSVNSSIYRFMLDAAAVKELNTQAKNGLTFTVIPVPKLSIAASAAIGNRPVFDFTTKDGNGKTITSYGKGTITRGIKYTAVIGEKTGSLFIVKIVDGKVQWIVKSGYDNGWVIWSGDSNSVYGVGYKTPAPDFTDTANHWAENDIDFAASRGLISGTTATTFSPNTAITRADFLMALGKLSGADVSGYKTSSFTDVPSTSPAMPYIEWAYQSKIVSGIGNNKFAPDAVISRQEMAVMMVNYAKATNYTLPVSQQAVTFADDAKIASWAKDQVKAIQQTGVISGKPNNLFDPLGNATRAEASAILHRFVELVIDEGTARGWVQNDAGQWQYINTNGKAVTGWLSTTEGSRYWFDDKGVMVSGKWVQIDSKWYYFYSDGKLAVNTTIDGYDVGADGARKEK